MQNNKPSDIQEQLILEVLRDSSIKDSEASGILKLAGLNSRIVDDLLLKKGRYGKEGGIVRLKVEKMDSAAIRNHLAFTTWKRRKEDLYFLIDSLFKNTLPETEDELLVSKAIAKHDHLDLNILLGLLPKLKDGSKSENILIDAMEDRADELIEKSLKGNHWDSLTELLPLIPKKAGILRRKIIKMIIDNVYNKPNNGLLHEVLDETIKGSSEELMTAEAIIKHDNTAPYEIAVLPDYIREKLNLSIAARRISLILKLNNGAGKIPGTQDETGSEETKKAA